MVGKRPVPFSERDLQVASTHERTKVMKYFDAC